MATRWHPSNRHRLRARTGDLRGSPTPPAIARVELVGIPWSMVIGPKGLAEGNVEIRNRKSGETSTAPFQSVLDGLTK